MAGIVALILYMFEENHQPQTTKRFKNIEELLNWCRTTKFNAKVQQIRLEFPADHVPKDYDVLVLLNDQATTGTDKYYIGTPPSAVERIEDVAYSLGEVMTNISDEKTKAVIKLAIKKLTGEEQ